MAPRAQAGSAEWINRSDRPPQCLSPHVKPPTSHYEQLIWTVPSNRGSDGRVLRWTCDCEGLFYELRQTGGLRFIRRTRTDQGVVVIEDSEQWRAGIADAQWSALLSGHLQ
jgi:hypothetical protein